MRVDMVGRHGLEGILADWEALHRADPRATPFTSPGWARAWLEHFAPDAQPWLLVVRDADRVVGLAPLALRRRGPVRLLEMLGKEPGDYWDVLAEPGVREPVTGAVATEIARRRDEWDAWQLNCLPPDSATPRALAGAGLRGFARTPVRSPLLELPDTFEAFLAGLPRSRRGNLRRHLRRLEDGSVGQRRELLVGQGGNALQRDLGAAEHEHVDPRLTEGGVDLPHATRDRVGARRVGVAHVRRGDDCVHALELARTQARQRTGHVGGAVVHAGEDVGVKVDHRPG